VEKVNAKKIDLGLFVNSCVGLDLNELAWADPEKSFVRQDKFVENFHNSREALI